MKRLFVAIVLLMATGLFAGNGYDVTFEKPADGIYQVDFMLGSYDFTEVTFDGITYSEIVFDGSVFTNLKGFAELPYISASLMLPADKNVTLKVIPGDFQDYNLNNPLLPSRGTIYRDQDPSAIPYEISPSSLRDNWYPQNIARNTTPFIIKDIRGTSVYVYPFRYNAVKNTLRVYKSVTVQLIENETLPINPLAKKPATILREMNGIYNSLFINYSENKDDLTISEFGDVLVISTDRDEDAIQPYIDWKREKGYNVSMEVVATGTNVKTLIQNAYDANNNLLYVQLVGDWADIKSDASGGSPMDPQLGCVVGSDEVADITIGRISSNSPSDVTVQIDKIINYEKNPEAGAGWYSAAIGIASDQGPGDDGELDKEHVQNIWDNKLDPFTYNDFSPIYDPSANISMVNTAVNNGASIINYCGHGSPTSWGTTGFSNSNVSTLTNGDKLPVIFSVACNNGNFQDPGDCFAEAWLKKENGGAVMFLGATISQPWQPPMRGEDYFNDILIGGYDYSAYPQQNGISTTEQRTTIGTIVFNGFALMTAESGTSDDWETVKTWTIFGDPSMQPRTETPGAVTLSNEIVMAGISYVTTVSGPDGPFEGAMVCISNGTDYFSGVTDASGSVTIDHTLVPGNAKMVVTGFNLETVYEDITIASSNTAWIIAGECVVDDSNGNNNGQADYGESVMLNVSAENVGTVNATGVDAVISTSDPYITITDNSFSYGDIAGGQTVSGDNAFAITIAGDTPDDYNATINIEFTDGNKESWTTTFSVLLHAPIMEMGDYTIDDASGNGNGKIDPGETVEITIPVLNAGSSDAHSVVGELASSDMYITITNASQNYGDINAAGQAQAVFTVFAEDATPVGHQVTFNFEISADLISSVQDSFIEVVGQIPVLVVDLDGNTNSGSAMVDAMANNGVAAEYATALPADLSLYSSVFLCLGIYSDNHVLSDSEGQALASYLNAGGNLYMEGGDTWYYDNQTPVHSMFSIDAQEDGTGDLAVINGQTGTFTEGMSFSYSGDNSYIDHIGATATAFVILQNQSPDYGTGVANDEGSYKTIGCSHEFGGLSDGTSPSTKDELMNEYLVFFGIGGSELQAYFSADNPDVCEGGTATFSDLSTGGATSWSWEFPGGDPASSSEQNPVVAYNSIGVYDVTLTVSDGTNTNTYTKNAYINVILAPDAPATPQGDDGVCTNLVDQTEYTTTGAANADSYVWIIDPADAGTISGTGTAGTVEWTDNWEGTATITVKGVNACGEGVSSDEFGVMCSICTGLEENTLDAVSVYPNPSSGLFTVELTGENDKDVTIQVVNTLSSIIYEKSGIEINGNFKTNVDLSEFNNGVYFLVIKNNSGRIVKRIIIQ
jgi:PKD repeat protein